MDRLRLPSIEHCPWKVGNTHTQNPTIIIIQKVKIKSTSLWGKDIWPQTECFLGCLPPFVGCVGCDTNTNLWWEQSGDISKQCYLHIMKPTSHCLICCVFQFCCYCSLWATISAAPMLCNRTINTVPLALLNNVLLWFDKTERDPHWWISGEWEETVLTQMNTGTLNWRERDWEPIQGLSW